METALIVKLSSYITTPPTVVPPTSLADLLADLRAVADGRHRLRASELDDQGAALIDLGWAERIGRYSIQETDVGLDVLYATRDVVLAQSSLEESA